MKKVLITVGKILLVILILIILSLTVLFIYHRVMLSKEEELLKDYPGQIVEVNGHKMNVLVEGEGEHTFVFLSGSGNSSPAFSFKPLCSRLNDGYRTVVIEKFGYGISDIVDTERDYKVMVDECREALSKAGVQAPYILCPHSKSGLDTLIWAQCYPDEVEAIVGLDMAFPKSYEGMDLENRDDSTTLTDIAKNTGIIRLFLTDASLPDIYTKDDKALIRAITVRKYNNKVFINEIPTIPAALDMINSNEKPLCPTLLLLSSGDGTGMDTETWRGCAYDYAKGMDNITTAEFDCSHIEIVESEADEVAGRMKELAESLG